MAWNRLDTGLPIYGFQIHAIHGSSTSTNRGIQGERQLTGGASLDTLRQHPTANWEHNEALSIA